MIHRFKLLVLLLLLSIPCFNGESSRCLMVYKEGGAPAVFQSPKCPRWILSTDGFRRRKVNCESAMLQGRRRSQEDRTLCALDLQIPFPGRTGLQDVTVGIVAVFDGHNGFEASEMASKLLLEYFTLHIYFLLDGIYSSVLKKSMGRLLHEGELAVDFHVLNWDRDLGSSYRSKWVLPEIFDRTFHMEILKESLLRAIHDIDSTFSKEALRNNLKSGSTATIVLIVDGQVLAANVGDSKAFLCSEEIQSSQEARGSLSKLYKRRRRSGVISPVKGDGSLKLATSDRVTHFFVKELTRDHHPDREDERSRVEAAGGYVVEWGGVPRVNGELAVSRAIGDVSFKSYGVIPAPEVTDWQPLTVDDSFLVVASDGIFDKLTTQDICDLLWDAHVESNEKSKSFSSCMHSLADCIANIAFEKGSMDNMAAVVVPLRPTVFSGKLVMERCDGEESIDSSALGLQKLVNMQPANIISSGLVPVEYAHQALANFNRLLVEGTDDRTGCFYLSENLNENIDYAFRTLKHGQEENANDLPQALPEVLGHQHSGTLNLYNDQNLCLQFGMDVEGDNGQCLNLEDFSRFLVLLESIPFPDTGYNSSESFKYASPDSRYVLKRRFNRGSYGEVWLAFHWNCSQGGDTLNWIHKNKNFSVDKLHLHPYEWNTSTSTNSSSCSYHTDPCDNVLFILKRIMVERGTNVYLSGLREKYFGEIFLNASVSLGGLLSSGFVSSRSKESEYNSFNQVEINKSNPQKLRYRVNAANKFQDEFSMHRVDYEEGLNHIARYVESFESQSKEIWLVFQNEGISLSKLMYTTEEVEQSPGEERGEQMKNVQVLHPSTWWHWLRTTEAGKEEMRSVIWQLLMALKSCHDRNITHRDIKPENMVICFEDKDTGRCLKEIPNGDKHHHIKISEQTYEYTPPEALLNASWFRGPASLTMKYDMWSVGVVILELILGSPHVFQINARTCALLDQHLEGWNEGMKELAHKLRSFMEMCILIPGSSAKRHHGGSTKDGVGVWPASWKCTEESFADQVKRRDPIKLGFPDIWALRLVRQLLVWDPEDRLSIDDALQHPYFQPPPR
ncbi:uncharacterized protein LOC122092049 isoform X3 [Macadamia integrifolia]|uniref:uncharacterized protein LOC122092049 isoform X3 n=2 Tax=Macadamia integrifolia TaxID=60698 RepID=UPI001C4F3672|nr:uncharacterized protein LOC122092049 isoform X3 [Macadamia integrifolia]